MTEREKVIKGLELCGYKEGMPQCDSCPYDGKQCWKRLKTDALALLKAQEPRVMTLGEVQKIASIRDGAIWLEAGAGLMPAFMEFATKDITFFVAVPLTGYRQFFENDWYGKTWRCWTYRPDQATREATSWDAQEQRDYEAAVEMAEYCKRYEPTYNADDGSM